MSEGVRGGPTGAKRGRWWRHNHAVSRRTEGTSRCLEGLRNIRGTNVKRKRTAVSLG